MAEFRPLFVFGLARSGTNLIARMLDRHPQVALGLDPFLPLFKSLRNAAVAERGDSALLAACQPTSPFHDYYFIDFGAKLLDTILFAPPSLSISASDAHQLREAIISRSALESPDLANRMIAIGGACYAEWLHSGLGVIASRKGAVRWSGSKEVWSLEFLPWIAHALPEAQFVIIERDPRAVLASLLEMARRDPIQAAHPPSYLRHWRKQVALCREFLRDPKLASSMQVISFEALVREPGSNARQLCERLGLEFDPVMLELSASGWRGNSSYEHDGRDVYTDTVNQWRRMLPEDALATADFMCGPEMSLTNYKTAALPSRVNVQRYLDASAHIRVSWRSDSGDARADLADEETRYEIIARPDYPDNAVLRRNFLFAHVYESVKQHIDTE